MIELSSEIVILKLYSTTKLLFSSVIKPMKVFLQERATPTLEMEIYTLTYSTENIPRDFASWAVGDSKEPELPDGNVALI